VLSSENVLAGLSNGDIKMWDLNSGTCLKTFTGHTGGVLCLQKFSDDKIATCSSDKTIKIWNYLGECLKTIDAHSGRVWSIDILTGNKILSSLENATIKLWNIDSGECLKTFNGHASHVWCLEILRSTTKD
jgi:WD40 repeat protein